MWTHLKNTIVTSIVIQKSQVVLSTSLNVLHGFLFANGRKKEV